jgi:DNA-binding MarR family transcriptional regulator
MEQDNLFAANQILEIIPLVMRTLRAELRQPEAMKNPAHFGVLVALTEGPHHLGALAEIHNVTLPTMSNIISTLVGYGLIRRTRAADDRRRLVIELTAEGAEMLAKIQHQAAVQIASVLEPLSPEDHSRLLTGLAVLRTAFTRRGSA